MMKVIVWITIATLSLWSFPFSGIIEKAKEEKKLILIELVMESCSYCEKMERFVLSKEDVKNVLEKNYILVKLDIHKDEIPEFLTSRITPTFYFLNSDGTAILHEVIGAPSKSEFMTLLERFGVKR